MLTAGEFVMSKGAVQKYGVDTLKEMNASGGGTNKPKVIQNKLYAQGGGYIGEDKEKPPTRGLRPIIPQATSPVTNIFQQQGLARGTRATAGFTGMGKPGFDAISGGAKYIQSNKPQILGHGAYSAPTLKGAMRYAGAQGSLGGSQVPGGVIRTIVPGGAARIPFLEPQMKVAPEVFDKGKSLADKLQSGYRPNSALANRLRGQMASGAGRLPRFNIGGLKNLKGGSPLQMIANLALGNVLDRGVEAVGKPLGNALARTLLTLTGNKERASKIYPELFGMMGPQLTPDMVENQQQKLYRIYGNQSTGQTQPQSIKPTGKVVGRENLSPQAQKALARLDAQKAGTLPPDVKTSGPLLGRMSMGMMGGLNNMMSGLTGGITGAINNPKSFVESMGGTVVDSNSQEQNMKRVMALSPEMRNAVLADMERSQAPTAQLATTTPSVSLPSPPVRPQAKVTVVDGGATVSQTAMESSAASYVPPIPSPPKSASKSKILGIPLPF